MSATLSVTGLNASILSHDRFAETLWYRGGSSWHYHGPGDPVVDRLSDWGYLQIDPDLREMCRLLHRHGLSTTPSCQGHFFPRAHFLEIWSVLLREAQAIHGGGLLLRDAMDGTPVLFRDDDYALPWQRANEFVDEASAQQEVGYLGVGIPGSQVPTLDRMLVMCQTPGVRCLEPVLRPDGMFILGLEVSAGSPVRQSGAWASVREAMARVLATVRGAA